MKRYTNPSRKTLDRLTKRPALVAAELDKVVQAVFERVQKEGDRALRELTKQFDDINLGKLLVTRQELNKGASHVPIELKKAIDIAFNNIWLFHARQAQENSQSMVETMSGVVCWQEIRPIGKVGLYIPGGTAPLVSTVLMLGVPAMIAGCAEIIVSTPPNSQGKIEPAICYAALKIGASKVVSLGGSQAIAAMALGTKSVPKVDKIFGPGNQYVTAAKQRAMKYGVAVDIPAGPSEVMVVADASARPAFVAADLLSQAEHGADSQVVLLTNDRWLPASVEAELQRQVRKLPRRPVAEKALANSFCITFNDLDGAVDFANTYAPEHLILNIRTPSRFVNQVKNAGSVFLGNYAPESAGDYASGTNHTLPTGGWARSFGGVSLDSFVKKITFQKITKEGLQLLAPTIEKLAEAEGLQAHKRAVNIRLKN